MTSNFIEGRTVDYVSGYTPTVWFDMLSTENQTFSVTVSPVMSLPDQFLSEDDVKMFTLMTRSFVNPIVCLLGFIGNSLGVGVLWRQAKQQKLSIFWYLCALTIIDNVWLGVGVLDSISRIAQAFDMNLAKYLMTHFKLGTAYCDSTSLHSARYVVLLMSCERLLSIVRPLRVKETWFAKYPLRMILTCVLFNLIFNLPILTHAKVVTKQVENTTEYIFTFRNYKTFMAHYLLTETIIHSFIPMLLLIPINLAIPVMLYRVASKLRAALNKDAASQNAKVTAITMTITIMYIFLSVPMVSAKVLQYVNPDFNMNGKYRLYFWSVTDLGRCLAYLNAANDFPVYFLVSSHYRDVFKALYCKKCIKPTSNEPRHDKTNNVVVRPAQTQISLGIHPVRSDSLLSA